MDVKWMDDITIYSILRSYAEQNE